MSKVKSQRKAYTLITEIYVFLMLTVFLFYAAGGYTVIQDAKFGAFCIVCGGYVGVMFLLAVEGLLVGTGGFVSPKELLRRSSWAQRLALIYLVITWLSALFSDYFPETVLGESRREGAFTITLYVLSFLLVSVYGRADKYELAAAGAAVAAFCVIALLQTFNLNPFGLYPEGYDYSDSYIEFSGAYLGTIGNVDMVASFLCLVIPLLWVSLARLRGALRWLLIIPLGLALALLVRMSVMAGFVGVGLGSLLCLPFVCFKTAKKRLAALGGVFALLLAGAAALYFADMGSGMLHEIHELLHGRASADFGSGRLHIWSEVINAMPGNWLLGSGPDTMIHANLEAFERYDERLNIMIVSEIDTAHNEYLNILFHQGVFALAAYLGMLIAAARGWIRRSGTDGAACALGAAVLCYCVQAFFGIGIFLTSSYLWLALGLLESRVNTDKQVGG